MPQVAERSLAVKSDFPIFQRRFGGRELVYLDSAATSQKPESVIEALAEHLRLHNANIHRGVYPLAQEADTAYDAARSRIAAFTGAEPTSTIFTKNVTEAINLVAYSWCRANVHRADAVSLIDGAQAVPQLPVDVKAIGADFYAWTGHHALGPTGIGALHGRRELLERM